LDNLSDIVTLVRVVEARSFVAAAHGMGVTPSAVSKSVSRLEERLGVRLLNRTTRSLSLTDAGNSFYQRCRSLVGQLNDAEAEVAATSHRPRGRLRVDMPTAFGREYVLPALPRFLAQYPEITLQVSMTDRLVDMIEEGIDVVIRVGKLTDSRLVARQLAVPQIFLIAAPDYLQRRGTPVDPEELKEHTCIRFFNPNTGATVDWCLERNGEQKEVNVNGPLMFNSVEALLSAAIAGLGITAAPTYLADRAMASGLLTRVLPEWHIVPEKPVSALWVKDRHASPKIEAFVDFLASLFPAHGRVARRSGASETRRLPQVVGQDH
jgi:LysR family transcriptional regulator for bpeEF and oprC